MNAWTNKLNCIFRIILGNVLDFVSKVRPWSMQKASFFLLPSSVVPSAHTQKHQPTNQPTKLEETNWGAHQRKCNLMQKFSSSPYSPLLWTWLTLFLGIPTLAVWGNRTVTGLELLPKDSLLNVPGAQQRPLQDCGPDSNALSKPSGAMTLVHGANRTMLVAQSKLGLRGRLASKHAGCPNPLLTGDIRGHLHGKRRPG